MTEYKQFGYQCLGPLLYGFSDWLYKNVKKENIYKVYFFSRDGFVMKKAFDMMYGNTDIKTYYLEVSRRSLRVPILWKDCSFDNLLTMLGPSRLITIRAIFDCAGLDIEEYNALIKKFGFNKESYFFRQDVKENQALLELYKELSADIISNSMAEFECLKAYITHNDIEGKIAIVDIGWSGGMQRFLQTALKELSIESEIHGYYTGVADFYKRNITAGVQLNLNGYLFDFYHNTNDDDCRSCFVGLYEMLFLEQKGSVKRYVADMHGVKVERYNYEYCINGKLLEEVKKIVLVQDGAMAFIGENLSIHQSFPNPRICCKRLIKAGQKPTNKAIRLFANFRFFDEGEYLYLAKPQSFFYYCIHLNQFKKDFLKSRWKTAFLRRIFKIPLPYNYLYRILKKF